ncbi:MAG: ACT domain-containing protein [Gemmiger sp.]|nr:ACT domain-containing protein [Gemmiger sp.]
MYGVTKLTSQQNVMLATFPRLSGGAQGPASLLGRFAEAGIVVDMICQSVARGGAVDFSFTTDYGSLAAVMRVVSALACPTPPLVSGGYVKLNLYGAEMVTSCGVAARALAALEAAKIEIAMITTSDLDISLLVQQQDEDTALAALAKQFAL